MMSKITKIKCGADIYEVGKDNIVSIKLTDQGPKDMTVYKIDYADGTYLLFGTKSKHEVMRDE